MKAPCKDRWWGRVCVGLANIIGMPTSNDSQHHGLQHTVLASLNNMSTYDIPIRRNLYVPNYYALSRLVVSSFKAETRVAELPSPFTCGPNFTIRLVTKQNKLLFKWNFSNMCICINFCFVRNRQLTQIHIIRTKQTTS